MSASQEPMKGRGQYYHRANQEAALGTCQLEGAKISKRGHDQEQKKKNWPNFIYGVNLYEAL